MVPLPANQADDAWRRYREHGAFFPLVAAVIERRQRGAVFADDGRNPRQYYVEHAFGFAQCFGEAVPAFESRLRAYLLEDRAFAAPKVRLYTPSLPDFLAGEEAAAMRSERRRYRLGRGTAVTRDPFMTAHVTPENFHHVEAAFRIATRFWSTPREFVAGSLAVVALQGDAPVAICYAAAVSDARAEIDVVTLPAARQQGAGRQVVGAFVARCQQALVEPLWDCFTNNAGSVQLARSCGFMPAGPAYPFFTFPK